MSFQQHIRQYSNRAMNNPRSREAVVLYGYIVAATFLPFAGPALKRSGRDASATTPKGQCSSLHCRHR